MPLIFKNVLYYAFFLVFLTIFFLFTFLFFWGKI